MIAAKGVNGDKQNWGRQRGSAGSLVLIFEQESAKFTEKFRLALRFSAASGSISLIQPGGVRRG